MLDSNETILKTGLQSRKQIYVDSPDITAINLEHEFFGTNLTYDVKFDINSSILPYHYVDKKHKAIFDWPQGIKVEEIVFLEMFTEINFEETKPNSVYGIVQTLAADSSKLYTTHYVNC
eukprot:GHVR01153148.1.p1 GENE.GHVR01153148.1~~GHVR01153148.1.p1  ORF type:complete len:119 (+),score=9.82 GHVR01153148.1:46-402(+)